MVAIGALFAGLIPIPIPAPTITATMAPSTMATAVSIITTVASRCAGAVPIDLIGSDDRASELARQHVGTPVFGGMIFAFGGIFAIPPLYVFLQATRERLRPGAQS
jgi:hypothetical protein